MANQIQLVMYEGYLVNDPEMRFTPQGQEVVNFRMGSNRAYKTTDGNQVKEVTWLKVTVWGKRGEAVHRYTKKGSHVIVSGRLRVGENGSPTVYQLKNGDYGAAYEITADSVRILDKKSDADGESQTEERELDPEDIPF